MSAAVGALPVAASQCGDVVLCRCVKYKDRDEMACCAVPCVVHVPDPCACCDPCNCCCAPRCVAVKICVPPCGCARVTVRKCGRRVKYDYGKYEVDIRVKDGYVEVDYQD